MAWTLVTGGARSGKSAFAERLAAAWQNQAGQAVIYVATGQALDAEMAERIAHHRHRRPSTWRTVEEPSQVARVLGELDASAVVLIDCLSLLVSNWLVFEECTQATVEERGKALVDALASRSGRTIVVTNEIGMGIVPLGEVSRRYRDALGWLNQAVAAGADKVILTVAGVPVDLRQFAVTLP